MAPAIPSEPISLLLKESVIVVLQKDGGLDNMEVQGTIALQVRRLVCLWHISNCQPGLQLNTPVRNIRASRVPQQTSCMHMR